ncbi:MAG: CPBP family intramembrane metalloprotease [Agathobacter sp.]|nr:CPBP family intramembrane metalloprotease [Agathobacter sp.]
MQRKYFAMRIWDVLYPLLLYYAVILFVMFLMQLFIGMDSSTYMIRQIVATLVALPVVYTQFYKPDAIWRQAAKKKPQTGRKNACADAKSGAAADGIKTAFLIVAVAACCGIGLNNLLSMSPLVEISTGFAQANEDFYGGAFVFQIIGSAILTPILEEMVYRGVIYARLRRDMGMLPAILLSALLFGIMHFNIVQFIYAFVLGVMLSLFMEKCGHFSAAVLGHVTVNLISVVRTQTGILQHTVDGSVFAWVFSVAVFAAGAVLLYICFVQKLQEKE